MVFPKVENSPSHANMKDSQIFRSRSRDRTVNSANSKTRRLETVTLDSGLLLICNENLINNVIQLTGTSAIDALKDYMVRYLKSIGRIINIQHFYLEILQRLRPIDIQTLCEYSFIITQFSNKIVPNNSYKRSVIFNILLDLYLNENPKYLKLVSQNNKDLQNMKQSKKDVIKLSKWLKAHQKLFNSNEISLILDWVEKDYIKHYKLFHFQPQKDEGALDIVFNMIIDTPTIVPSLNYSNFIPSNQIQSVTVYDSEEEEPFAYKREYFQRQNIEMLKKQSDSNLQLQQMSQQSNQDFDYKGYIDNQVEEVEQQFSQLLLSKKKDEEAEQKKLAQKVK